MGNARQFLDESKTKKRRGTHNRECREKVDAFIEKNGTTKLDDCMLIKDGSSGIQRVNERFYYKRSLPGKMSRDFRSRDAIPCEACGEDFIPRKVRLNNAVAESRGGDRNFTIWCEVCRRRKGDYRDSVRAAGGLEKYKALKERIVPGNMLSKLDSLVDIEEQIMLRKKLNLPHIRSLDIVLDSIMEKAYKHNEEVTMKNSHYEFDF